MFNTVRDSHRGRGIAKDDARRSPRVTFISWAADCSRSDHIARELGGTSHMVYSPRLGSHPATIALKYAVQWFRTVQILRSEAPDIVFVMTPPLFAALPAFWYSWRRRKHVVLDAHTCAFVLPRWRSLQWLQRAMCRRAIATLVTNDHIATLVSESGGEALVVPDVPIEFSPTPQSTTETGFRAVVVSSFDVDEPIGAVITAAGIARDVRFFVTGDTALLDPLLAATLPGNLRFTGFLSTPDYGALISSADVVVDLTVHDHTMLRGAYEAIYQGVPVIVSDWPVLREAFPAGAAVHVDNTPEAIADAVQLVRQNHAAYRAEAERLRRRKLQAWDANRGTLLRRIATLPPW